MRSHLNNCGKSGWSNIIIVGNAFQRFCGPKSSFDESFRLSAEDVKGFVGDENGKLILHENEIYLDRAKKRRQTNRFPAG